MWKKINCSLEVLGHTTINKNLTHMEPNKLTENNELKISFPKGDEDSLCEVLFGFVMKYKKELADCEGEFVNLKNKLAESESRITELKREKDSYEQQLEVEQAENRNLEQADVASKERLQDLETQINNLKVSNDSLSKTIESKKIEIEEILQKQENLKSELESANNTITGKEQELQNVLSEKALLNSQLEGAKAKNEKFETQIGGLTKKIEEKESHLNVANSKLEVVSGQIESLSQQILSLIKRNIDSIFKSLSESLATIENGDFRQYIEYILNGSEDKEGLSKMKEIDSVSLFEKKNLYTDSPLTKLANICWWAQQPEIASSMLKLIPSIQVVADSGKQLFDLLSIYGHKIKLPQLGFSQKEDGSGYGMNDNVATKFGKFFVDVQLQQYTFCEIYKLNYNEQDGQCLFVND